MSPPKTTTKTTDSIGRFRHLLAHVGTQLPGLAAEANTFEEIRDRYAQTMTALANRGLARVTAPRSGVGAPNRLDTRPRAWSRSRAV